MTTGIMEALVRSVAWLVSLGVFVSTPLVAQGKLKVYIASDMEGVAGVVTPAQAGGADYEWARGLLLAEVNAAIGAAFDAGATEVVINDAHGTHTNLRADLVDQRATLITGRPKPLGMVEGLDPSFDAVAFIGFHGHANQVDAVMGHTYTNTLLHVRLNGREVGEYGTAGMVAGGYNVPVVFVSGDQVFAEEARRFFPGVEALAVKEAIGQTAAKTISPNAARQRIAAGVKAGLARRKDIKPIMISHPIQLEIGFSSAAFADAAMMVPGVERVDGLTVRYRAPDAPAAYKMSRLLMTLAR